MKLLSSSFLATLFLLASLNAKAAPPQEAPPLEPPYTTDSEFDPLLSEDPSASSNSPIQTSQPIVPPTQETPSQQAAPAQQAAPRNPNRPKAVQADSEFDDAEMPPSRTVQRKGVKMIPHPNAKKGLVRIQQDGTYVYKVKTRPTKNTGTFRFGQMEAPRIVSADGRTDFSTMYEVDQLPMLMFDYDWQPFDRFGKLGAELGIGFAIATGKGRFLKNGDAAEEVYTFIAIPVNAGLNYRFQYARKQWIAPYISGGFSYIAVAEARDDNKQNFTGTPAAYGAGGLMFNITAMDPDVAFTLDTEYGVGGLWLTTEFRYQNAFSEDLDFSGSILSLGVSAEF